MGDIGVNWITSLIVRQGSGASPGQATQMKNQEAMKKLPQLVGLRRRQLEAQHFRPMALRQRADDLFGAGRQLDFVRIRLEAEHVQELEFKGENHWRRRRVMAKAIEKAGHQFKDGGQGGLRFRGLFDERGGVGRLAQPLDVLAKRTVRVAQADFPQRMQIGTAAPAE